MILKPQRVLLARVLTGLGLLLGPLIILAGIFAPTVSVRVDAVEVRQDDGFAYIVPFRRQSNFLFHHQPDGVDSANASRLILFEGGKPLGPAHSPHDEIRRHGAGRFSHWGTAIWFSSSDGTDPRTNGRNYVAEVELSVRPVWILGSIVLFGAALFLIAIQAASGLNSRNWRPYLAAINSFLVFLSRPSRSTTRATALASFLGVLICVGAVIYGWYDGDTPGSGLGVVRFFPVSDAFGYHSCATSIAAAGRFDEPFGSVWCARRALYPAMLASLLSFTAWSSQLVLIAQGMLIGLAIATFALTVSSVAGLLAAVITAVLLFFYAWEFVLGLFMTEVLGFTLGLFGLTLLAGFCKTRHAWQLLAGAVFISVGLAARAGALFVLPALPIWAALAFRASNNTERGRFFLVALLGVLVGPLLQFVVVSLLGADSSNTGGNFAASLYGLSTGSRDWSQAYRDFEPLFKQGESEAFRQIYIAAWQNIQEKPAIFLGSLWEAGRLYFNTLFSFVATQRVNETLSALAVVGAVSCLVRWQHPLARLILALATAEILAAPLIIDSGGTRVFAVTASLRILLCAIGVQWLLHCFSRLITHSGAAAEEASIAKSSVLVAASAGTMLLILIIVPATPLAHISQLQGVAGLGCPVELKEVVARIGKESQSLTIVETSAVIESLDPFRIAPRRLLNDSRIEKTWFGKDFLSLSAPFSIVRAVDLSSPAASAVKPLAFKGLLADHHGVQSLCVDEAEYVEIAGVRHHLIKQIRSIDQRR